MTYHSPNTSGVPPEAPAATQVMQAFARFCQALAALVQDAEQAADPACWDPAYGAMADEDAAMATVRRAADRVMAMRLQMPDDGYLVAAASQIRLGLSIEAEAEFDDYFHRAADLPLWDQAARIGVHGVIEPMVRLAFAQVHRWSALRGAFGHEVLERDRHSDPEFDPSVFDDDGEFGHWGGCAF